MFPRFSLLSTEQFGLIRPGSKCVSTVFSGIHVQCRHGLTYFEYFVAIQTSLDPTFSGHLTNWRTCHRPPVWSCLSVHRDSSCCEDYPMFPDPRPTRNIASEISIHSTQYRTLERREKCIQNRNVCILESHFEQTNIDQGDRLS